MQRTWTWRRTQKTPFFSPGWAVSLRTSEGASQETGEDGTRLGSLVSSELESKGERGADLEGSRGTSDRALGQGWLLGHFCPSTLPPQHFLGSRGDWGVPSLPLQLTGCPPWEKGRHASPISQRRKWRSGEASGSTPCEREPREQPC